MTHVPADRGVVTTDWYAMAASDAVEAQSANPDSGLETAEAARRRERVGPNRFAETAPVPQWRAFVRQYRDLMQIVLVAAAAVAFWPVREYGTAILLLAITVFNAVLSLRQEGRAAEAAAALARMLVVTARVRRDGALLEMPAEDLVPGDVVALEAGDVVPADGRLLSTASVEIDESALTGESVPVPKDASVVLPVGTAVADRVNAVHMNTNVTRGSATMLVTATGMSTEVGHISSMLGAKDESAKTPLTLQLDTLVRQILVIAGIALVVSIALNVSRGQTLVEVFAASVAFAIAAIPEELPAVVTAILARGTQLLAASGAILKQLRSSETLGATSAINSDKTGTLTLNQMTAISLSLVGRRYEVTGTGYGTEGRITRAAGLPDMRLDEILAPMVLTSDAVVTDGVLVGDPTEGALVVLAEKGGVAAAATRLAHPRLAVLPFDAAYKLMATFHSVVVDGTKVVRCYVKGAPDQLLSRATTFLNGELEREDLTDEARSLYLQENERLGREGLRVMATAFRDLPAAGFDPRSDLLSLIGELTLLAMVGILDPPRPQARDAIATAKAAGIRVRMITGDHVVTATAIATDLGIEGRAISGKEFAAMSDEAASAAIGEIGVLARVTPEDKVRLVDVLKANGDVVAMTGDGVNDAPALKRADIGIAMGITGTEVSKEAAVMILTNDDFATIVRAVEYGRGLYDDLTRYVRFQMGCLFGIVASFLGASIFNVAAGVPFLPLQTLWINFSVILSQAIGLGYGAPSPHLMAQRPRDPSAPVLRRTQLVGLAVIGLVLGACTLGLLSWAWTAHGEVVARTMGLSAFLVGVVLLSLESRDQRRSMFARDVLEDRTFVRATALSVLIIVLGTSLEPLQRLLTTTTLDLNQWLLSVAVGCVVVLVLEPWKWYVRRRDAALEIAADR